MSQCQGQAYGYRLQQVVNININIYICPLSLAREKCLRNRSLEANAKSNLMDLVVVVAAAIACATSTQATGKSTQKDSLIWSANESERVGPYISSSCPL